MESIGVGLGALGFWGFIAAVVVASYWDGIRKRESQHETIRRAAALSSLSPAVRSCIVLSYHEGMSHEEISRTMELPMGTVKSHIKRGSEKLRHLLAAYQDNSDKEQRT